MKRDTLEALAIAGLDLAQQVMSVLNDVRTGREPVDVLMCGLKDDCVAITQVVDQELQHRILIDAKALPGFVKDLQVAARVMGYEMTFRKVRKGKRK